MKKVDDMCNELLELKEYRKLGTLEELRILKEKSLPKKVLLVEDVHPENSGMYATSDRWCPACKRIVFSGDWNNNKQRYLFKIPVCACGQRLDWS